MAEGSPGRRERLDFSRRVSLTARILAVNIIALGLMAGSLFYLDSYRKQLFEERFKLARAEAEIAAAGLNGASTEARANLFRHVGSSQKLRLRLYDRNGGLVMDSFGLASPSFSLVARATSSLEILAIASRATAGGGVPSST